MNRINYIIFITLTVGIFYSLAQETEQRRFFFGPAIEYGIPYRNLSNLGFAAQTEFMLNNSFGIIGEYSSLNYNGQDDQNPTINLDFTISAPALYLCWHTPAKSTFELFIAVGAGYTTMKGKIGTTSFVLSHQGKSGIFLPQAKLGTRFWVTNQVALRVNLGFYRPFSIGLDYSL